MKRRNIELFDISIILLFFLLSALVFFPDFLFLKKVFFFNDIGADTWNLFFPEMIQSQRLGFKWWTFYHTIGIPHNPNYTLEPISLILYNFKPYRHEDLIPNSWIII